MGFVVPSGRSFNAFAAVYIERMQILPDSGVKSHATKAAGRKGWSLAACGRIFVAIPCGATVGASAFVPLASDRPLIQSPFEAYSVDAASASSSAAVHLRNLHHNAVNPCSAPKCVTPPSLDCQGTLHC